MCVVVYFVRILISSDIYIIYDTAHLIFQMNNSPAVIKKPAAMIGPVAAAGPTMVAAAVAAPEALPKNIIQTRELLYRLIISQLFYDGYQQVAVTLSNMGELLHLISELLVRSIQEPVFSFLITVMCHIYRYLYDVQQEACGAK